MRLFAKLALRLFATMPSLGSVVAAEVGITDYISDLKSRNEPVFISVCQVGSHIKAALIFDHAGNQGDLIVVNTGSAAGLQASGLKAQVIVTGAGVDIPWARESESEDVYRVLAANLTQWPFQLLLPERFDEILTVPASEQC